MSELRFRVTNFLGGLNEIGRPDLLQDNEVQELLNYSVEQDGTIKIRPIMKKLDEEIDGEVGDILKLFVWYPNILPEGSKKNYLLLVYDNNRNFWVLCYREVEGNDIWESLIQVYDDDDDDYVSKPIFEYLGIPFIANTQDRIMLVDGRNNSTVKYIAIDKEKKLMFGEIGIPAPIEKAVMSSDESDNVTVPDDSTDTGMGFRKGSILFMAYTAVTEDGVESDPSPISVGTSQNYYTKDENYNNIRFWQKTIFNNLVLRPDISPQVLERIKYFNVYLSYVPYTESEFGRDVFRRTLRIPIKGGANTFVSTTPPLGNIMSQESSVDVKGDDICYTGGVTFISNVNRSIKFPFNFDYYSKIDLTNNNNRNYTNANITFTLEYNVLKKIVNGEEVPIIADKQTLEGMIKARNIRFYDFDMRTPLMTTYKESGGAIIFMVKVPYIPANTKHSIYLVMEGEGANIYVNNASHGKFLDVDNVVDDKQLDFPLVRNSQDLLVATMEGTKTKYFSNKCSETSGLKIEESDTNITYNNSTLLYVDYLQKRLLKSYRFGDNKIIIDSEGTTTYLDGMGFKETTAIPAMKTDVLASKFPDKGYLFFTYRGKTYEEPHIPCIRLKGADNKYIEVLLYEDTATKNHKIKIEFRNVSKNKVISETLKIAALLKETKIFISWDKEDGKIFWYCYDIEENGNYGEITDIEENKFPEADKLIVEIYGGFIGNVEYYRINGDLYKTDTYLDSYNEYSLFILSQDAYINDLSHVKQIVNFLPYFPEELIGGMYNNNIQIHPAKPITFDTKPGILQFSTLDGQSFPTLNYIRVRDKITRIFPAPNYLKDGSYMNCVLIFGDDFRQRLLLSGNPDSWSANMNEILIDEKVFHGLSESSKETVQMIGDTLFWLSGDKLMMENIDGLRTANMAGGFDRVKIPYPKEGERYISYYDKINNKLHLCNTSEIYIPDNPSADEETTWTAKVDAKTSNYSFTMMFTIDAVVKIDWYGDGGLADRYSYHRFEKNVAKTIEKTYPGEATGNVTITFTSRDWGYLYSLSGTGKILELHLSEHFDSLTNLAFTGITSLTKVTSHPMNKMGRMSFHGCSIEESEEIDALFNNIKDTTRTTGQISPLCAYTHGVDNAPVTSASDAARTTLGGKGFDINFNAGT